MRDEEILTSEDRNCADTCRDAARLHELRISWFEEHMRLTRSVAAAFSLVHLCLRTHGRHGHKLMYMCLCLNQSWLMHSCTCSHMHALQSYRWIRRHDDWWSSSPCCPAVLDVAPCCEL